MTTDVHFPGPQLAQDVQDVLNWSYVRTLLHVVDKTKVNLYLLQKANSEAAIDFSFLLQPTSDLNAFASDRNMHNEVCLILFDFFHEFPHFSHRLYFVRTLRTTHRS